MARRQPKTVMAGVAVAGTVTDQSVGVVSNLKVTARNTDAGSHTRVETDGRVTSS